VINFHGQKVGLGPPSRENLPAYQKWLNDFEVNRTLNRASRPLTFEGAEAWLGGFASQENRTSFTIYELATLRPIGNAGLFGISPGRRCAHFGIMIGEKDCWGRGYGTETGLLMLDYAFRFLGLHSVQLGVYAYNERAIGAYARAGYRVIGRVRESHRLNGRAYDTIFMDCLASEFLARWPDPVAKIGDID
jgi:RimJ/RimL family protein N-acetyltransferase